MLSFSLQLLLCSAVLLALSPANVLAKSGQTRAAQGKPHIAPTPMKDSPESSDNHPSFTIFTPDFQGPVPDVLKPMHSSSENRTTATLSQFDDRYFNQASANLVIQVHQGHNFEEYVDAVRQASQALLKTNDDVRVGSTKVDVTDNVLFLTVVSPHDQPAARALHLRTTQTLAALHSTILDCHHGRTLAMEHLHPAVRRLAEVLSLAGRHPSAAACEDTQLHADPKLSQPRFSIAYPTADYRMDHTATARRLQSQHPAAMVYARELGPPVISNPVMVVARKTLPVYTLKDGSSRYRMLAEASHPAHGNVTIGYDVLVRPESLSLDDAGEVISVFCEGTSTMRVSALHPLPISAPETVLEGAKEWGCTLKGDSAHSFVVSVKAVSSAVLPSGIIEYTMQVQETAPFSAASIWDSVIIMHPPTPDVLASKAQQLNQNSSRALGVQCSERTATLTATNGYAIFDCDAETGDYGNYNFNYNRATGRAVTEKLYIIPGQTNVWFDNTYAHWTTVIELRMAFYAGASGFGLPLFEVLLKSSVGASLYLKAELSWSDGVSSWQPLTNAFSAGSFSMVFGVIPFNGAASVQLVARKSEATAGGVKFVTGASASASAWVGLRYEAKLGDPTDSSCYCVSACSSTFGTEYCYVNEGCQSASAVTSTTAGFKWKYCNNFQQTSGYGTWKFVRNSNWATSYTPPSITAGSSSVNPGRLQYHLGARLGLTLYSLIPLYTVLYWELNVDVTRASRRSLRQPVSLPQQGWGRELLLQCGGSSGSQTGQISFGVGNIGANMGVDDVVVSVLGYDYTLAQATSVSDSILKYNSISAGQLPICASAPPTVNGGGTQMDDDDQTTYGGGAQMDDDDQTTYGGGAQMDDDDQTTYGGGAQMDDDDQTTYGGGAQMDDDDDSAGQQGGAGPTIGPTPGVSSSNGQGGNDGQGGEEDNSATGGVASAGNKQSSDSGEDSGASSGIIGGVAAGIVVIGVAVAAVYFMHKRKASQEATTLKARVVSASVAPIDPVAAPASVPGSMSSPGMPPTNQSQVDPMHATMQQQKSAASFPPAPAGGHVSAV